MVWCDEKEKEGGRWWMDPRARHARAIRTESKDRAVWNNLITHYSKSNVSSYALSLFHHLPNPPNVVSWTALISGHSNTLLSLRHFLAMLRYPTLPNHRTLATLFESFPHAPQCPQSVCRYSPPGQCLLFRLGRCSCSEFPLSGRFIRLYRHDSSGFGVHCSQRFRGLRAAAQLAALEQCKMMHAHVIIVGFDTDVVVGSALVNGYGKAGVVNDARRVFEDSLSDMNIVVWNAMMAGYAQQGDYESASELFESMKGCGLVPDEYSFLAILTALCNAGMFRQIDQWFTRMIVDYGLDPSLEHCTCLVGAIARMGEFERAERIVLNMPFEPDAAVWRALLWACANLGEADRAWYMAKRVLELEPHDDFAYVVLSNVLSSVGRWDDVAELRKMIKDRRVKKK
ncbi:hypothetical protein ACSQ67_003960 [Phaseolus vulgaris]